MSADAAPVGIVGLGLIGTALAERLLGAGLPVMGLDRDIARTASAAALGVTPCSTLGEIVSGCARIILAVYDTSQVETVLAEIAGLPFGGEPGRIVIVVSTCDPDRIATLGRSLAGTPIGLVEAPISGTSGQLKDGKAVLLVAGEEALAARCDDIFAAVAQRSFHVGVLGNGNRTKLAINLILGLHRAALAEGLVVAEGFGLDPSRFLEIAKGSAAYSQIMDVKGRQMVEARFEPQGRIRQSAKDFALIEETAERVGLRPPLAALYAELMADCLLHDEADLDNAAVIRAIRRRAAGGDVRSGPVGKPAASMA